MQEFTKYIKRVIKLGAKDAKIISTNTIVTAEWVRLKCQFGCGGYGQSLTCPPYSPTIGTTQKLIQDYQHALLIHGYEYTDIRDMHDSI